MARSITTDNIVDALMMNGIEETQFFDDDEWDEFINLCISDTSSIDATNLDNAQTIECVEEALANTGRI